jgi:hypothetical protein
MKISKRKKSNATTAVLFYVPLSNYSIDSRGQPRKGRSFLCCFLVSAVAFMLGSLEIEGKQEKSLV